MWAWPTYYQILENNTMECVAELNYTNISTELMMRTN